MSLAQSSASSQPITIILLLPKLNQTATVSQRYPLNITTYIMAFSGVVIKIPILLSRYKDMLKNTSYH